MIMIKTACFQRGELPLKMGETRWLIKRLAFAVLGYQSNFAAALAGLQWCLVPNLLIRERRMVCAWPCASISDVCDDLRSVDCEARGLPFPWRIQNPQRASNSLSSPWGGICSKIWRSGEILVDMTPKTRSLQHIATEEHIPWWFRPRHKTLHYIQSNFRLFFPF